MNRELICIISCIAFQAVINPIWGRSIRSIVEEENTLTPLSPEEKQCVKTLGLNEEHILAVNNEEIAPENDEAFNKFMGCFWNEVEFIDKDGDVKYDTLRSVLCASAAEELKDEDEDVRFYVVQLARRAVTYCEFNPSTGNSLGQIAVKTQNCIVNKLNEMVSDIDDTE